MIKNTRITIRFPAGEAAKLEAQADAEGMTVSEWTRAACARYLDIDQLAGALARELAAELKSDLQAQTLEVIAKLKVLSDQIADLATVVIRRSKS